MYLDFGEEIGMTPIFWVNRVFDELGIPVEVGVYIFTMNSDSTKKDSDYDRVPDSEDPLKMKRGISNKMSSDYKDKLYSEIDAQIKEDFSWIMQNKNVFYYSTEECMDIIYKYDEWITELSNKYLLPKAAIQTILLRELRCYDIRDDIADGFVVEQYAYLHNVELYNNSEWWLQLIMGYPEMPFPYKEDSSVGYGQIFASTAINANNWAVTNRIISGYQYDYNNWKEREEVWTKLKDDNNYNIGMIALVLIYGADDQGLHDCYWRYDETELKTMLSRYNGFGDQAVAYGNQAYNCYEIFDKYNAMDVE